MFIIAALVHFVGVIFYAIFASGEIQDWAIAPPEDADNMMMTQVRMMMMMVMMMATMVMMTVVTMSNQSAMYYVTFSEDADNVIMTMD